MSRSDYIELLTLLSALESWGFSAKTNIPEYLHDRLADQMFKLTKQILGENEESK